MDNALIFSISVSTLNLIGLIGFFLYVKNNQDNNNQKLIKIQENYMKKH